MGKKVKVGKQRRDKAYWSAKEIGFRSRASFKLLQLNRKFEFLQKSRICLDLCAAPGSWMQVAKEHMPLSSLIIGVDLVAIKPLPGTISLVNDIRSDKCRSDLKKELQGWKTDVVLHDGAPNVGKSWIHDAFQQSLLTLSAFKLATEFLRPGGTFVTKVFRSKDYQSLLWVFQQFFKKVHSTKPSASRSESAEIFVVCLHYKAPDKIDPRFLDPKTVFSEIEEEDTKGLSELKNPEKKRGKAPAIGYDSGVLLYSTSPISEFIFGDNPIHLLNNTHSFILDSPTIVNHSKTNTEILECLKDIKVLGMKELRALKKWREILRMDLMDKETPNKKNYQDKNDKDEKTDGNEDEDEELRNLEKEIQTANEEEKRKCRRKKKILLKAKRKRAEKIDLKMTIPGDVGPVLTESGLFEMKKVTDSKSFFTGDSNILAESSDENDEHPKKKKNKTISYSKEHHNLDDKTLNYKSKYSSENEEEDEEEDCFENEEFLGNEFSEEAMDKLNEPPLNPLFIDFESKDGTSRKEKKASLWFSKSVFETLEKNEEDEEEMEISRTVKELKRKGRVFCTSGEGGESGYTSGDSSSSIDSESDDVSRHRSVKNKSSEKDFEIVPISKREILNPEECALGEELIYSRKRKRDLMDEGWNRYMFDDKDSDLPPWFVAEEEIHMRRKPDVNPETVAKYSELQKGLNVKTIKKVVEAKARKKRRMSKKMDKAKKRAASILDSSELGSREKAKEIQRLYRRAEKDGNKEVTYTVAKKFSAAKRPSRPSGLKGLYKQVDPRMKKDTGNKRDKATTKRSQKRRLKGRKTKPNV